MQQYVNATQGYLLYTVPQLNKVISYTWKSPLNETSQPWMIYQDPNSQVIILGVIDEPYNYDAGFTNEVFFVASNCTIDTSLIPCRGSCNVGVLNASTCSCINATAEFGTTTPNFTLTHGGVEVLASVNQIMLGSTTVSVSGYNVTQSVDELGVVTHHYSATTGNNSTTIEYSLAFYNVSANVSFAGQTFGIPLAATKWSIALSGGWPFGDANHNFTSVSTITLPSSLAPSQKQVYAIRQVSNTPEHSMTTYMVSLSGPSSSPSDQGVNALQLEVFDIAVADGQQVSANHSVEIKQVNGTNMVILMITFNQFKSDLMYDPILQLSMLLGPSSGSTSTNTALIIGLSISVPSAIVLVMVGITVGTLVIMYSRRRFRHKLQARLSGL